MSPEGLTSAALGFAPLVGLSGVEPDPLVGVTVARLEDPQAPRTAAHATTARPTEITRRIEQLQLGVRSIHRTGRTRSAGFCDGYRTVNTAGTSRLARFAP
jgi:hypothetical protein